MRQTHAAGERLFVDYAGDGVPVVDRLTGEIKKAQIFVAVLGVTRRQLLEQIDRPALKPLPAEPYVFSEWRVRRVGIDYHVEVAGRYYSVPYRFARAEVDVRLNAKTVDRSRTHAVPPPAICGLDDRAHPRRRAPDRPRDRNAVRADPLVCTAWPRRSPKPPPTAKPKFSAITNGWGFYLIASGHGGRTSASRRDCVSQGCGSRPCVEDVDYRSPRGLDRALFQNLIEGEWINVHDNLALTGPTGVGKSWLASALGHKACRDNHSVLYQRVPRLFEDLALARGDGRHPASCAVSAAPICSFSTTGVSSPSTPLPVMIS